ncbi:hypothetical protein CC2G_013285 [Coprinopsis cinerea AmutBmut pab1-1]|nr:hypothetical protein CC2G_013285 [Coprinopsis cinerea AmutBmut pab1-1]
MPAMNNCAYTIEQLFDVPTISTASLLAEINGWLGQTFSGPWSGVDYILTNVSC